MSTIAILGTMDSKGEEHAFLAAQIQGCGHQVLVVDVGTLGPARLKPDVTREEVARAAGADLPALVARQDRGECVGVMSRGAPIVLSRLVAEGRIAGVISLGGGGGTAIATAAMRALPIGFPTLMVSTLASGNTAQYVGCKDIVMFPSIVDVAGLNRISRQILTRAAGAICGMVETVLPEAGGDRPIIAASQFGNTTGCVDQARQLLEREGYEVLVFHATGTGGRTMESLVESGMVAGCSTSRPPSGQMSWWAASSRLAPPGSRPRRAMVFRPLSLRAASTWTIFKGPKVCRRSSRAALFTSTTPRSP